MSITVGDAILYLRANDDALNNSLKNLETNAKQVVTGVGKNIKASLDSSLGGLSNNLKKTTTDLTGLKRTLGSVVQGLTGFNIVGLGAVGVATGLAVGFMKATNELITYNKSILDASRATRMTVGDMARFVQVGDDVGVEMGTITQALQLATKNGFAPSLVALADLADKANAMASPTERAAMLAKILGRNWAALDPILQLGKTRILEMAAAQADGLVPTEAGIAKTEAMRMKIDELNDAWTATKNNMVLNVATAIIDSTNQQEAAAKEYYDEVARGGGYAAGGLLKLTGMYDSATSSAAKAVAETGFLKNAIDALPAGKAISMTILLALQGLRGGGIGGTEGPGIGGADQRAAEEWARSQKGGRIAAESQGRPSGYYSWQGTQGAFAQSEAHPAGEFTGGNTPNDNAWRAYWDMMAKKGKAAQDQAALIAKAVEAIPDKTVTVTIVEEDLRKNHTYQEHGAAGGADFVVPPGYPNDSYPMRVQSGERVQVTPSGESGRPGIGTVIINDRMEAQAFKQRFYDVLRG